MKRIFTTIRLRWIKYLEKLAKVNEELYGNKRLDCCDMNKTRHPGA